MERQGIPMANGQTDDRIAEHASAEEALRRSEEQYRSVVDNIRQVIFQTDARGRFVFLNAAWTEITGFTVEESLGVAFLRYVHPDDRQRHAEVFQPLIENKNEYFGLVTRYVTKAGSYRWIEVFAQLREEGGAIRGMFGTLTDITERRRAEEELTTARARLQHLLDSSPAVIYSSEPVGDYAITFVGDNITRQLGYGVDEVLNDPTFWMARIHPEDAPGVLASFAALVERSDDKHPSQQYRVRHKDGTYRWIHDQRRLVRDAAGSPVEIVGSWVDLTEHRRAEEERGRLEEQLRQAQKMEIAGRLAGGVAHDFNNLLTVIGGRSQIMLHRWKPDDPQRRDAELILETAQRAAALTRQLLVFSRKQMLAPAVLDLNGIVGNMDKMLRRLIGEDIELVTVPEPALGRVKADPSQIEQVVMNLVVNARDAMPLGGRVTIETANVELGADYARHHVDVHPGAYVMLAVSDTGCGIDPEIKAHIFEPFFTTKAPDKGTGLGLSTVYGIVKQSDGHVVVDSEPGHGATFRVYLPCVDEAAGAAESARSRSALPRGSETILLTEDEQHVRELAREILQSNGYTVLEASDGVSALETSARHTGPIHLLVTDIVMPHMGGGELARRLTHVRPETRVLYMSGYTDDALVSRGVSGPQAALIEKPFTVESLTRKVREVLEAPRGAPDSLRDATLLAHGKN